MRKIILQGSGKYVGMDFAEALLVPDDTTNSKLDQYAWEASVASAEMYGYYLVDDYSEDEDGAFLEYEVTGDDLGYFWEDYDPEKHDMIRGGGGSFEDDF